ncbi:MAG: transporter substrate-binding domain-containing protein [Acidobacteriota bacterium]|nr:transporter substrate-binding domain-containing protein [Acidobacteriota bacterium]
MRLERRIGKLLLLLGWCMAQGLWGASGPRLVVGTRTQTPPYEYSDEKGQLTGYCVELLRACAVSQGLDLEFRQFSNTQLWEAVDRGELDLVSAAIYSEERLGAVDFSVPLAYVPYILVRRSAAGIQSERDLKGKELLVVERSAMMRYASARGLSFRSVPDYETGLRELAGGKGDAILVPKFTWLQLFNQLHLSGLQAVPTEIYPERVCFAVRKGHSELLAKLNEAVFQLKSNGKLDQIYDRHLGSLEQSQLPFKRAARKMAVILLPALLLLAALAQLAWTFSLRRLVKQRTSELSLSLKKREEAEAELETTVERLSSALREVKQLSGLLPICAKCKKIRDSRGGWQPLESYISAKSEATFSHGICPECSQELYPEYHTEDDGNTLKTDTDPEG